METLQQGGPGVSISPITDRVEVQLECGGAVCYLNKMQAILVFKDPIFVYFSFVLNDCTVQSAKPLEAR